MDLAPALVGGAVTLLIAALTSLWARQGEKERRADERLAEKDRWEREDAVRRAERGEAAASAILITVDEMALLLGGTTKPEYEALEPLYVRIRQQSTLLTDEPTREKFKLIANNLYYYAQAIDADRALTRGQIAHVCARYAADVMTAYLHDRPMPVMARFNRLTELHDEGGEMAAEQYGDDYDPLAAPEPKS